MPARVAIVGGGITGLAVAYHLERLCDADIDLYEAASWLGGKLRTFRSGRFLVEEGPDAFFTRKPGVMDLIHELGLEAELIEPQQNEFFMLTETGLARVPRGLAGFKVTQASLAEADFLSAEGKLRALDEPNQPAGSAVDESIHSFFSRRFGEEFSHFLAEPLLAGTHGGDADNLSMRALYPGYLAMEKQHGTVSAIVGDESDDKTKPAFMSFRDGMGALPHALESRLKRTRLRVPWGTEDIRTLRADQIVLAVPAPMAARLIGGRAGELLGGIEHRSSAVVTLAFPTKAIKHPLDGTGFLVPTGVHDSITGVTWSSRKWRGRSPKGTELLRIFMKGTQKIEESSHSRLAHFAQEAILPILGITGEPTFVHVSRWMDALPQYTMEHLDLLAEARSALSDFPNLHLVGTSYDGVGIPDCLSQARGLAERIGRKLN